MRLPVGASGQYDIFASRLCCRMCKRGSGWPTLLAGWINCRKRFTDIIPPFLTCDSLQVCASWAGAHWRFTLRHGKSGDQMNESQIWVSTSGRPFQCTKHLGCWSWGLREEDFKWPCEAGWHARVLWRLYLCSLPDWLSHWWVLAPRAGYHNSIYACSTFEQSTLVGDVDWKKMCPLPQ